MMTTTTFYRTSFINTFSKNSSLYLQGFFRIGYVLLLIPFKIVNDEKRGTFTAKISRPRQVISGLRLASILILAAVDDGSQRFRLPAPGPMKVFLSVFSLGASIVSISCVVVMNLPRTRVLILDLLNLLSRNYVKGSTHKIYSQQILFLRSKNLKKVRKRRLLLLASWIFFHYIFLNCVMCIIAVMTSINQGTRGTIRKSWNMLAKRLYPVGKVDHFNEMSLWMKFGGLWILSVQIDVSHLFATTIVSVFFATRTLQEISKYFMDNLLGSQMYCTITLNDIILNFRRVQRAFFLISTIFTQLTFLVVFYLSVGTCIMAVLVFTDSPQSFPFTTACLQFYFFSIMMNSADAAWQLTKVTKFLQSSPQQDRSQSSLQRMLILYEIGSSSVGLSVSNIFIVTYAFTASVVVSVLSNATIVLQSLDFYAKAFPSRPPPSAEED